MTQNTVMTSGSKRTRDGKERNDRKRYKGEV